ncbi:MAG: hypothetical protein U1E26_03920 [Coriobacteriia bacterium]|nr:hypothetical protein [Coriobacteriia bacterium]
MSSSPLIHRLARITLAVALVAGALATPATANAAPRFNPLDIISYEVWRDVDSMSEAQIQRFLARQPGVLDTYVAADHQGVRKRASRIIYEAAQAWDLNPKVILATLQKEQSLLAMRSPGSKRLNEAMGCGIFPGSTERFPGFGNQVWHGTRKLSTYETDFAWRPGLKKEVTVRGAGGGRLATITPRNACTYALYTYTPFYPQRLFWDVYVRYFGDPRRTPPTRAVHRLVDVESGAFFYTWSTTERFALTTRDPLRWRYDGVAFALTRSASANRLPLMRLHDRSTGAWRYTVDPAERDRLLALPDATWEASGTACLVAPAGAAGTRPVYRLESTWNGGVFLTSSPAERADLTSGENAPFLDRGTAFGIVGR